MEPTQTKRKPGARKKEPAQKKASFTISLSSTQGEQLDEIASKAGCSRSELIIRRFRLK